MKKYMLSLLAIPMILSPGCGTTPIQRQEITDTLILISAAGMQAYVTIGLEDCKGDAVCQDRILGQYAVYTNAVNGFLKAYQTFESYGTNRPALLSAFSAITAAGTDVTKAILAAKAIK